MFAEQYNEFLTANRYENSDDRYLRLRELLDTLPDCNYYSLKFLMQHLNHVASHQDENNVCSFLCLHYPLFIFEKLQVNR